MPTATPFRFPPPFSCLGLLLALGLSGCAQVYDVKVDARQNPEIQSGHSYRLVTKPTGGGSDQASEKRAEAMVHKALAGHGMYQAEKPEKAEVTVEVAFEVGARRIVAESVDPINGTLSVSSRSTVGPSSRDLQGGTAGIVEDRPVVVREIYEKKLTIVAREGPAVSDGKERPPRELWRVEARLDDEKDTVDKALPVLVGAAVDHINSDSATQQTKRVSDKSEPVNFVTSGS